MAKKFVSNRLGRFAELGKSLTKATGHLALDKLGDTIHKAAQKKTEVENFHRKAMAAKEIIKSMGELKGALMKLGQMLSITEDLIIPPEISKLFTELQKNAPSMNDRELDQVFKESFNKLPEELFLDFNRVPMAAASIGQVHKATLHDGTHVAVKVQYPKIVKAIKNDFENLESLKKVVALIFPKVPNIDSYLFELKRSLAEECDYHKERESINFFRESSFEKFPQVKIPKTYEELSSGTILTLEFMEGEDFIKTKSYDQQTRDSLGQLLYDYHNFCFYELRCLHTDPQYGNFLFTRDTIILLDFGSVRTFNKEFVEDYIVLLKSIEDKDLERYREVLLKFGFFEEYDTDDLFANHLEMVHELYIPYIQTGKHTIPKVNPIDLVKGFVDKIDLKGRRSPREEFLLLDRAHLGLYTKLRGWTAAIDWVETKVQGWELYENL
ncbi:MAG: AarF/ABC1/UbiB kinase family protein [Bacteriovoracaceae bacterium]|nr:AarF/ABC1/UbiB kinase family protein [Bacteriovoracaceae bacterium]